jgi:hypothetical protein
MNSARDTRAMCLAAALSALFLAALTGLSLVTFDHLKYVLLAAHGHPAVAVLRATMTLADWGIVGATAVLAAGLVVFPAIRRGFVELWSRDSALLWLPVGAALLWCGHSILGSGLIVTGDAGTHVARVNHLALALRGGDSVFWDNYFFGGSTLLQFTGPVFHWIAAATQLVVGDPTQAVKYVTFAARLAAALFMYLLVRGLGARRATASLAALFYGGAFFMTYMEIVRSSFPQLINFAAMPAVFYCLEQILRRPAMLGGGTVGLALGAILFIGSHQPTALIFSLLLVVYLGVRFAVIGVTPAAVRALAAAAILTGLGSVYFLVPFALERGATADDFAAASLVSFALPSMATLVNFVVWGGSGTGAVYAAYVGLPMLVSAAAGGCAIWAKPQAVDRSLQSSWWLMLGLAVLTLVLRGAYVREATFTFFFLCVAGGLGLEMITRAIPRHGGLLATVFVLALLDAGPLAVQPWTRSDMLPLAQAGEYMADRAGTARVVEVDRVGGKPYITDDPTLAPLAYGRLQILMGPHKQDATKAHNGFAALLKITQQDLQVGRHLEPETRTMLAAANVGWLVGINANAMGLPDDVTGTVSDPVLGSYLRIPEATPFLVSGRLETMARPAPFAAAPFWDFYFDRHSDVATAAMAAMEGINERMHPDPATRQAAAILVPPQPAQPGWDMQAQGEAPTVQLLSYVVHPGTVRLSVEADRAGFIRLAHPLGLGTQVMQDGRPVTPLADVQSLIVLPLHAGRNDFVIAPEPSGLRTICFWVSMITLGGLCLMAIVQGGVEVRRQIRELAGRRAAAPQLSPDGASV